MDELRDDIWKSHPQIQVVDFDIYSMEILNQCENSNDILMAVENWNDSIREPLLYRTVSSGEPFSESGKKAV